MRTRLSSGAAALVRNGRWASLAVGALLFATSFAGCTGDGENSGADGEQGGQASPSAEASPAPTQSPLPEQVNGYAGDVDQLWATPAVRTTNLVNLIWATDTTVATVTSRGVTAFAPDTGEELWDVRPPAGSGELCWASTAVNDDGIGAVLYAPTEDQSADDGPADDGPADEEPADDESCSVLAAVDAASGDLLWSHDLAALQDGGPGNPGVVRPAAVSVGDDVVAVSLDGEGPFFRFAVDGGAELPALDVPGGEDCRPYAWRHTARLSVGLSDCDEAGAFVFDTESGETAFSIADPVALGDLVITPGDRLAVWRDETLAVYNGVDGEGDSEGDGEAVTQITVPQARTAGTAAIVTDSTVVGLSGAEESTPRYPHYAGWDLATGERLWEKMLPGSDWYPSLWYPAGDGDRILVSYPAWVDEGNHRNYTERLGWLNPRDGSLSDAGLLPEDADVVKYDVATGDPGAGGNTAGGNAAAGGRTVYMLTRPGERMEHVHLVAYELPD